MFSSKKITKIIITLILLCLILLFFNFYSQWLGVTQGQYENKINSIFSASESPELSYEMCGQDEIAAGLFCELKFTTSEGVGFGLSLLPHTNLLKKIIIAESVGDGGPSNKFIEYVRQSSYMVDSNFESNADLWNNLMLSITEREFRNTELPFVLDGVSFKYYRDNGLKIFIIYKNGIF